MFQSLEEDTRLHPKLSLQIFLITSYFVPNERKRIRTQGNALLFLLTREIDSNFFVLSRFPLETDKILQCHDQTFLVHIENIIFFIGRLLLFSLIYSLLLVELRLYCLLLHVSRDLFLSTEIAKGLLYFIFFFEFLFKKIIKKVSFFGIALRRGEYILF